MRTVLFISIAIALFFSGHAAADTNSRWIESGNMPIQIRSVLVIRDDQGVVQGPTGDAPGRGSVMAGKALPIYATRRGSGCADSWLLVGPLAWLCQSYGVLSKTDPFAAIAWPPHEPDGLPFVYYSVGNKGTQGYAKLQFIEDASPEQDLQPGFVVAIVEQRTRGTEIYGKTHHGFWVPLRDLLPIRASTFHGEELVNGHLDFAWSVEDKTTVFVKTEGDIRANDIPMLRRFQVVQILEEKGTKGRTMFRIDEHHWVRAKDLRRPRLIMVPTQEVAAGERWLDVDLASQTLVAYQGNRPVFATLVSTGRGEQGTATATPKGIHRIWVKLRSSTMDNLEDETAKAYSLEDVPYVQFFSKGVGLHGAFWHQSFGHIRSHGCVNLAPLDAQRLFDFTSPKLPTGWTATFPNEYELGTVVYVH